MAGSGGPTTTWPRHNLRAMERGRVSLLANSVPLPDLLEHVVQRSQRELIVAAGSVGGPHGAEAMHRLARARPGQRAVGALPREGGVARRVVQVGEVVATCARRGIDRGEA